MGKSRTVSLILILIILLVISIATGIKVYNNHKESLMRVVTQKIEEAGEKCFLEGKCEEQTSLKVLIEKGYIDRPIHPLTKEFVDENLKINCSDYTCYTKLD